MTIDHFKQVFQDEARELLSELESALLELDQNRDDKGVVGRAFLALHTIKGSSAMFGFDEVARFAHHFETVFDKLRNGELLASADLINLSLAALEYGAVDIITKPRLGSKKFLEESSLAICEAVKAAARAHSVRCWKSCHPMPPAL